MEIKILRAHNVRFCCNDYYSIVLKIKKVASKNLKNSKLKNKLQEAIFKKKKKILLENFFYKRNRKIFYPIDCLSNKKKFKLSYLIFHDSFGFLKKKNTIKKAQIFLEILFFFQNYFFLCYCYPLNPVNNRIRLMPFLIYKTTGNRVKLNQKKILIPITQIKPRKIYNIYNKLKFEGVVLKLSMKNHNKKSILYTFKKLSAYFLSFLSFFSISNYFFKKKKLNVSLFKNILPFFTNKRLFISLKRTIKSHKALKPNNLIKIKISIIFKIYLTFFFWKMKYELELLSYVKYLKYSQMLAQRIKHINGQNIIKFKNEREKILKLKKNLFYFLAIRYGILIQEFPHSLIIKARLLAKNLRLSLPIETNFIIKKWTTDIQEPMHHSLLFYFIFLLDIIFSIPSLKKISNPLFYSSKEVLSFFDNLFKVPQNFEKLLSSELLKKKVPLQKFFLFFKKNGLIDFWRKFISKTIINSCFKEQKLLYKNIIAMEYKNLSFHSLGKNFLLKNIMKKEFLNYSKILKILYDYKKWDLFYKIFCETYQDRGTMMSTRLLLKK